MKIQISITLFLIFITLNSMGQSILKGTVRTKKGEPIPGANIYFKNTFEGISSDSAGYFLYKTNLTGSQVLVASFLGYKNYEQKINLKADTLKYSITLFGDKTQLDEVVINAGTFEAGDEKKSAALSTLDMATNSHGFGDIIMAVNSLPGTSTADDEGGLLVRGGERYETKTFIDGMLVESPYTAKMPSVPVKGKFSPMLFRGTIFSTGGYSAEYGQALSSALILNTVALPKEDETNIALYSSAVNITKIKKWENSSISSITQYINMQPSNKVIRSNFKWDKDPENLTQTLVFRQKTGKEGMLKAMGFFTSEKNSLFYPNLDTGSDDLVGMKNKNYFILTSYKDQVGKSILHSGISLNYDDTKLSFNNNAMRDLNRSAQIKLTITNSPSQKITIKSGGDIYYKKFGREYLSDNKSTGYQWNYKAINSSAFTESNIRLGNHIALRAGLRFEYLELTKKAFISPRISTAYQLTEASQISFAYGKFTQLPEDNSLVYNSKLMPERANHLIVNYQILNNSRTFRIEAYHKKYTHLIKYESLYETDPDSYSNTGSGFARGIDIFFRDREIIKNGDFWLAYSFIDSKRNYRDFDFYHTPEFVTRHNLSLQYKHYFEKIDSYFGTNYNFATGRPYIDPNIGNSVLKTKYYHNLSASIFHFTEWFGKFTMLHLQVSNLPGFDHVFGYRFANNQNHDGIYSSVPILPPYKRMIIFGIYICLQNQTQF
ncbi:MAG: TonB-dependent receptor [Mariniphaga sp.]|nr:TonB-dependent receptor [Mariniphaga sp.]